jgi:opacity protein-like surface antigen
MNKLVFTTVAAVTVLMANLALADDGAYVGLGAGSVIGAGYNAINARGAASIGTYTGYVLSLVGGYRFSAPNLRTEVEVSYRSTDCSYIKTPAPNPVKLNGAIRTIGATANLWYDVHQFKLAVVPYLGGGLGIASFGISDASLVVSGANGPNNQLFNKESTLGFAYQIGGGVSYDVSRHVSIDAGYRYYAVNRTKLTSSTGGVFDLSGANHNAMIMARWNF